MSDINDATRYLDEDGLLTLAGRIEDVYAKKTDVSKSIQATYEQSPTLARHAADEYLYIKTGSSTHITYKTLISIEANTELVVGTNVKVFDDTGIPVYVDKVPGAGGGGVITAADVSYDDGTVDDALTELNSKLGNYLMIKSYIHQSVIPALGSIVWNPFSEDNISVNGYTPIGVIQYRTADQDVYVSSCLILDENYAFALTNTASSSKSLGFTYVVLYIKNS